MGHGISVWKSSVWFSFMGSSHRVTHEIMCRDCRDEHFMHARRHFSFFVNSSHFHIKCIFDGRNRKNYYGIYILTKVYSCLTHWSRVTHICVSKLTIAGSDNGLSPGRRQAIIWTNAGIMLIRPKLQWNFNRNYNVFIQENEFENVVCEVAAILSRPQLVKICFGNYMPECCFFNK